MAIGGGLTQALFIDFAGDGFGAAGSFDDVTAFCQNADLVLGMNGPMENVASVGNLTVTMRNDDKRFSPLNASSPYYGLLTVGTPIKYQIIENGTAKTRFNGYVAEVTPNPSIYGRRTATIFCTDAIGIIQEFNLGLPLQQGVTADYLLKLITSAAFRSGRATGTISLPGSNVADGDTLTFTYTINNALVTLTYRFKTTPAVANDIKIGATPAATITNLIAAMVSGDGSGASYFANTKPVIAAAPARSTVTESIAIATGGGTTFGIGKFSGLDFLQAQSFTPAIGGVLSKFTINLVANFGSPTGTITYEIRGDAGGTAGPSTTALLKNGTFTPTPSAVNTINILAGPTLTAGVKYWLVLYATTPQANGVGYGWQGGTPSVYAGGNVSQSTNGGATYSDLAAYDTTTSFFMDSLSTLSINVNANARGAWGNAITMARTGTALTLSGANLTGGVDGPASAFSYDTGLTQFDIAADRWTEDKTNGLDAITEVVVSEQGLFWARHDGTLIFKNRSFLFNALATTPILSVDDTPGNHPPLTVKASSGKSTLFNRVIVNMNPRRTLTPGLVVAQARSVISVPGTWGQDRYNPSDDLPSGGIVTQKVPFVDVTAGKVSGAQDLILPLAPSTDWTANTKSDGTGEDYTFFASLYFSVAINGGSIEVTIRNTALGTLYITKLQVRGTAIVTYDPLQIMYEDVASQIKYKIRKVLSVDLPLPVPQAYADSLCQYLLGRYRDPSFQVESMPFVNITRLGAKSILDLQLGDVISYSETQMSVSGFRLMLVGTSEQYNTVDGGFQIETVWKRLDDLSYWILQDATYGQLGSTTRLAV